MTAAPPVAGLRSTSPHVPATPLADQAQSLRRLAAAMGGRDDADRSRATIVAITSGKGGVGKTMLGVNLAIVLAQFGTLVTLVDADLGTANADLVCGVSPARRLESTGVRRLDDLVVPAPGGFRLVPGSSGVARMADLDESGRSRLVALVRDVRRTSDVVLVDTGAGVGAGVLDLVAASDVGVVVATPDPASIADAYALIKCLVRRSRPAAAPRLMLLVNQAPGEREALEVHDRLSRVAARFLSGLVVEFLAWVPSDARAARSVRSRRPIVLASPWSRPSRAIRRAGRVLFGVAAEHRERIRAGAVEGAGDVELEKK